MSHPYSTPAIRVSGNGSQSEYRSHGQHSPSSAIATSSTAIPMSIPGSREAVPPPLPPPKYVGAHISPGQDPGWQWGNTPHRDVSSSPNLANIKPGSSLLSASLPRRAGREEVKSPREAAPAFSRRSSQNSVGHDMLSNPSHDGSDDESRNGRPTLANFRLQSETELGHRSVHTSSQAYDKSLLSKIGGGGPKTPTLGRAGLPAPAVLSRSASEVSQPPAVLIKPSGQLKPLSMPDSRYVHPESPSSRWPHSAVSPRHGFRNPLFEHRLADTPSSTRNNSMAEPFDELIIGRRSHRPSVDQGVFLDPELMEENGMRELDINDRSPAASDDYSTSVKGTKRRASSPPSDGAREGRAHASGPESDLYHRRSAQQVMAHRSPPARYQPAHGSLASASSLGVKSSFASTASFPMSMASSHTSHGGERSSPGVLSPIEEPQFRPGPLSPYSGSNTARLPQFNHQDDKSAATNRPLGGLARMQGLYLCECCPKKPKRFDSREELDAHVNEKQYVCQFCPNRFKNKNEAERHQNSLHLRRHSWSCATLTGVDAAFHPSSNAPSAMDVCGYCGMEFSNPPDWNVRAEHLCQIHKFGECNQSKKFFRADHFRQHLKHSHAGTSGKWTNMLETACMREEAPPIPLAQQRGKQAQALASQATHALSQMNPANRSAPPPAAPSPATEHDTSLINPELDNA